MQSAFRMEKEDKKSAEGPEEDESVNLHLTETEESEAEEPNPMEGTSSAAPATPAAPMMSPAALAASDNEDVIDRDQIQ